MRLLTYINQANDKSVINSETIPQIGELVVMGDTTYKVETIIHNLNNNDVTLKIVYHE
jgi:hypothetical protein